MIATKAVSHAGGALSARILGLSAALLTAVVWVSSILFGLYILAFYGGALRAGQPEAWNETLPRLYEPETLAASIGIGAHFAAGGILLVLGPIQLLAPIRRLAPSVHRWMGRVYALCALIAGLGGLTFIAIRGTVGGLPMSIGFALYGALMALSAFQTARFGIARDLERHRAWAIRLFALAIGSWLYRMEYGFWTIITGGVGHTTDFQGWFDVIMDFFFYVPNLLVAEAFIRAGRPRAGLSTRWLASGALLVAAGYLALATWFFSLHIWAPGILRFT